MQTSSHFSDATPRNSHFLPHVPTVLPISNLIHSSICILCYLSRFHHDPEVLLRMVGGILIGSRKIGEDKVWSVMQFLTGRSRKDQYCRCKHVKVGSREGTDIEGHIVGEMKRQKETSDTDKHSKNANKKLEPSLPLTTKCPSTPPKQLLITCRPCFCPVYLRATRFVSRSQSRSS